MTYSVSIEPRQSSAACNIARLQIVKAISDTKSAVADIQDTTVATAAAAGVKQAQGGVAQVAKSIFSGAAPSQAGRNAVEAGLNATSSALAGGDTSVPPNPCLLYSVVNQPNRTDPAVADAQTSLQDAIAAGQAVVANC